MPEDNSGSLIPKPSGELSVGSGAERILSEMTNDALKIHREGLAKTPKPGTLLWEFEIKRDGELIIPLEVHASPAIGADGTVYVGTIRDPSGCLYALDGKTGAKQWQFSDRYLSSSPAIGSDGTVYVAPEGGSPKTVWALDGKTGAKKWGFEMDKTEALQSSPAIGSDGTIYIGSGYPNNKLYAINGKSGVKLWEFATGNSVVSHPAIGSDGTVYVGLGTTKLYALDGMSGVKKWEIKSGIYSSPAIGSDGTIYIGASLGRTRNTKIYAIASGSKGLADSPWPMFGQNPQHTGRAPQN